MKTILSFLMMLSCITCVGGERPNIILILADDHAFEAISAYGTYLKDYAQTPAIDRIGNEGMRFDNFTCNNSICSPSRASILTGQYSHRNGVLGLNGEINDTAPQFPVFLQQSGYQTFLVGKWHLQNTPAGFDKHMTVHRQGTYFDPTFTGSEGTWNRIGYSTDVYTDIAMDWLQQRDHEKPFLLCLQFKAPHHDYGHARRYDDLFKDVVIPEPPTLYDSVEESNYFLIKDFLKGSQFHMYRTIDDDGKRYYYNRHVNDHAPDEMWDHDKHSEHDKVRVAYQHMIHKYIRCISGNNDNVKRVLDYLDAEALAENTVVIYTSDQGYWLGQHGLYDKRLILETSIRMPFLIRYPKMINPGSVNDELCINVDIAPTLLELAGLDPVKTMQGSSLVPLLSGKQPSDWRTSQFYAYWGAPNHYGVRDKRFTYVEVAGHPGELFDRKVDPLQRRNFAGDPEYAPVLSKMRTELAKQIREVAIPEDLLPRGKSNRSNALRKSD